MNVHPNCSVSIQELSCADCVKKVLDEELEFAYVVNVPGNSSIVSQPLTTEPPYTVFSKEYPLASCEPLALEDFRDAVILCHKSNPLPEDEIKRAFKVADFIPRVLPTCDSISEMLEWTRIGRGIMLAGRSTFLPMKLDDMIIKPFPDNSFIHTHSLIVKEGRALAPTAKKLYRFLLQNRSDLKQRG